MSYNHPYRKPQDDFTTSHNMYPDSQRMYHRESGAYRSRTGTTSPEQTHSALSLSSEELSSIPPGKALSFLHSCGLDAGDLKTLAELPEHLISAEKLPELLAEIKKMKAANMSSSRSSTLKRSSSGRSWEDRRHTESVEYSLDLPARQSYSHHREQAQTLEDRWGDVQAASSSTHTYTSPDSNYVVEYNHLKDKDSYFDKSPYATESSKQKSAVVSQSYSNYSRDTSQPSYLSSRGVGRPSNLSSRDVGQSSYLPSKNVGQPSPLINRGVGQPSPLINRGVGQPSPLINRAVGQPSLLINRGVGQPSPLINRGVGQPSPLINRGVGQQSPLINRAVGQPPPLINRAVGQPSPLINRGIGQLSHLSSRNAGQLSHLSSRDGVQPSFMSSRDVGQPSYMSSRDVSRSSLQSSRNSQPSHLSGRNVAQPSHHRRTEVHKVPTRKEASDFHGKTPPVFPYACVLCEITVLSNKDWSVHINGPQHANSQLSLVERYPEWDQKIHSARRNEPVPEKSSPAQSRTTQKRVETSRSRNGSSSNRSSLPGSKGSNNLNKSEVNEKCKVVCVKFEVDEVNEAYLKELLGQFGAIVKLIMFPRMALVEMGSTDQAGDIVKYFLHNPLKVKGGLVEFSLSSSCSMIQSSSVVSFMPLPAGEGVSSELTAIAKRFGSVKHSLFLPSRGYVEMGNSQEASKLVEHYSTNSLKLKGKTIHVSFSAEYHKLGLIKEEPSNRSSNRRRRSLSPRRRSHSSRRDSPSPKRRSSAEMSKSGRSSDSRKRDEQRRSKERSRQRSGRDNSSRSRSRRSCSKGKQTDESAEEKNEDKMDQADTVCDDSDLEGVAVIADDCEELDSEDEEYIEIHEELDQEDDEEQDFSAVLDELEESDDMQDVKESSDVDMINTTVSDVSSECKDVKELQKATKEETADDWMEYEKAQELQENQQETKDKTVESIDGSVKCKEELKEEQKDKTVDILDGSGECKEDKDPQQETKDETVESIDGSLECKDAQKLQENQQETTDETGEITDGSMECKEELKPHQEEQKDKDVDVSEGQSDCKESEELQHQQEAQKDNTEAMEQCKVVCVKFEVDEVNEVYLKELLGQFGAIVKLIMFPRMALVEMGSTDQAGDIVKYFIHNPLKVEDTLLEFSLSSSCSMIQETSDVPVNLESCIILDEFTEEMTEKGDAQEISIPSPEEQYGRVLEVKGFPQAKKYSEDDLLNIGQKCGEVAGCCLVRNNRKVEKALIEMVNASDASKLEAESKRHVFKLGGKVLRITVSTKYAQIKKRVSIESDSGKAEGETHEEKNEEVMHVEEKNEEVMHVEEKNEDVMHVEEKNKDVVHVEEKNEDVVHVEEKNEVVMHVEEKNKVVMHVEEKNEVVMHVEEKNEEVMHVEEKNDDVMHVEEKNEDVMHVEEKNDDVMHVKEKNEEVMQVKEKNEEVSHSLTPCEDISGIPVETSEECTEAQKETNQNTMQTSSDEEEDYGKVLRIRNLPFTNEYTEADFVSIAERYGKVRRHWLFRPDHMGLIEMENASDAQKVVAAANKKEMIIAGKHPKIKVSMKHSHLNKRYFLHGSSDSSLQTQDQSKTQSLKDTSNDNQGVNSEEEKQVDGAEKIIKDSLLDDAVGTEFVRPVVGYFCNLCNAIYASEEEAKNEHCRTVLHHQKHKERMEQNSST